MPACHLLVVIAHRRGDTESLATDGRTVPTSRHAPLAMSQASERRGWARAEPAFRAARRRQKAAKRPKQSRSRAHGSILVRHTTCTPCPNTLPSLAGNERRDRRGQESLRGRNVTPGTPPARSLLLALARCPNFAFRPPRSPASSPTARSPRKPVAAPARKGRESRFTRSRLVERDRSHSRDARGLSLEELGPYLDE